MLGVQLLQQMVSKMEIFCNGGHFLNSAAELLLFGIIKETLIVSLFTDEI